MNIFRAMTRNADVGAIELPGYVFRVSKLERGDTENGAPVYS